MLGLPSKIVAGSGWHHFTLRVANTSDKAMTSVSGGLYVVPASLNGDDTSSLLTVQWYDEDAGVWKEMTDEEYWRYDAYFADLAAGEYVDAQLRLKADASTPESYGTADVVGWYCDENGVWHHSILSGYDVVAAGGEPGRVPPAKGKPTNGNKPAPQGDLKARPTIGKPTVTDTGKPPVMGTGGGDVRAAAGRPSTADDSVADSGASLAETGSHAVAGLLLGAGGTSIALGTALAAAAYRRRRHPS
ncbi:hypothetical protein OG302_00890 [Streptomyces sp. NBC_01283]|uniref:hypothetical protein n=1 Tax=Streptomyces sp. NBC_01283 TaxID=2903812 RepID=UPI00352EFEC6|nr:hypothetical protein OG302_00890 [Streptomyces sp. NBC_01283]